MSVLNINESIFFIPYEDKYIVYAPLHKVVFLSDEYAKGLIERYLATGDETILNLDEKTKEYMEYVLNRKPVIFSDSSNNQIDNAVILLTEQCNLACTYCYSRFSRSKDTLSQEKIKELVNKVLDCDTNKQKRITFLGGGEPTYHWNLFTWTVEYIRNYNEYGNNAIISTASNMTLLNEDKIKWMVQNRVGISASFDILPEIQNNQRIFPNNSGSFDIVDTNIKLCISNGLIPSIRTTITESSVKNMIQMVRFVIDRYPEIKVIHLEHATLETEKANDFYKEFIENFFLAKNIARQHNVEIRNSAYSVGKSIRKSFCGSEYCITPTGDMTSCHRVSLKSDKLYTKFNYGGNEAVPKNDDFRYSLQNSNRCKECFAKYNCAGGCPYTRAYLSNTGFDSYCSFVKEMFKRRLLETLNIEIAGG